MVLDIHRLVVVAVVVDGDGVEDLVAGLDLGPVDVQRRLRAPQPAEGDPLHRDHRDGVAVGVVAVCVGQLGLELGAAYGALVADLRAGADPHLVGDHRRLARGDAAHDDPQLVPHHRPRVAVRPVGERGPVEGQGAGDEGATARRIERVGEDHARGGGGAGVGDGDLVGDHLAHIKLAVAVVAQWGGAVSLDRVVEVGTGAHDHLGGVALDPRRRRVVGGDHRAVLGREQPLVADDRALLGLRLHAHLENDHRGVARAHCDAPGRKPRRVDRHALGHRAQTALIAHRAAVEARGARHVAGVGRDRIGHRGVDRVGLARVDHADGVGQHVVGLDLAAVAVGHALGGLVQPRPGDDLDQGRVVVLRRAGVIGRLGEDPRSRDQRLIGDDRAVVGGHADRRAEGQGHLGPRSQLGQRGGRRPVPGDRPGAVAPALADRDVDQVLGLQLVGHLDVEGVGRAVVLEHQRVLQAVAGLRVAAVDVLDRLGELLQVGDRLHGEQGGVVALRGRGVVRGDLARRPGDLGEGLVGDAVAVLGVDLDLGGEAQRHRGAGLDRGDGPGDGASGRVVAAAVQRGDGLQVGVHHVGDRHVDRVLAARVGHSDGVGQRRAGGDLLGRRRPGDRLGHPGQVGLAHHADPGRVVDGGGAGVVGGVGGGAHLGRGLVGDLSPVFER